MESFNRIFGVPKPVIAMLHLPALPGRPLHDRSVGVTGAVEGVARDLEALQAAGVDGLLFCNEADLPYQLEVGHEISAAMASIVGQLRSEVRVPFGVNILWDPMASLAVARATGARFIREVLTGVYESDLGMIEPHIGNIAGYRSAIGGDDIALFDNIAPEFASAIGTRGVAERAKAAHFLRMDAILISGPAAGVPFEMSDLRIAKEAAPEAAIIANTGVRADRIAEIFEVADGVIVGTSLKVDGHTWNPVDPDRAHRLMEAARSARSSLSAGRLRRPSGEGPATNVVRAVARLPGRVACRSRSGRPQSPRQPDTGIKAGTRRSPMTAVYTMPMSSGVTRGWVARSASVSKWVSCSRPVPSGWMRYRFDTRQHWKSRSGYVLNTIHPSPSQSASPAEERVIGDLRLLRGGQVEHVDG